MHRFEDYLLKAAMLAQEDPAVATTATDPAPEVAVDTAAPLGVAPLILYPWIVAQLAAGIAGYLAYDKSFGTPLADARAAEVKAGGEAAGTAFDLASEAFLKDDAAYAGFGTSRLIGFGTTAVGVVGAALAFVKPEFFHFATYASVLGGVGVLA